MSRKFTALLVSTALLLASTSTSAWSSDQTQANLKTAAVTNQAPLPAGGAAGIKQAQGAENNVLLGIGVVVGLFVVGVLLLGDDDDDETSSSTGTD